ncbi:MAG: hemerythrin domain-containing protein [Lentisphaerae bacterium]|nr:hemerythrin domain-containing protein [Lentisphaerota bacterium]
MPAPTALAEPAALSLTALADHIEHTHHALLRRELPRLQQMMRNVIAAHGAGDARLPELGDLLAAFADELGSHMIKEERILFPIIRQLDTPGAAIDFHCGSIANPIRVMEMEHLHADGALLRMRNLTDGFQPPPGACPTYRGLLSGLETLEQDMRVHVDKENQVLFPRALRLESERQT